MRRPDRSALVLSLLLTATAAACAPAPPPPASTPPSAAHEAPEFINLVEPWPYPFSSAVRTGNLLFLSGQIGSVVRDGQPVLVEGGMEAEARQAMDNIKAVVERGGSSMDHIVKCTVMLADMTEWPAFNAIYATYFPGPKPARAAFGANGLALNARVEIDCIAQTK